MLNLMIKNMSFKTAYNYLIMLSGYFFSFIKYLLLTILLAIVISVVIFLPSFKDLKVVAEKSMEAKTSLEKAVFDLKDLDLIAASEKSGSAQLRFSEALLYLDKVSQRKVVQALPFFRSQFNDLKYLIRTGEITARSLNTSSILLENLVGTFLSSEILTSLDDESNIESKIELLKFAYEAEPELIGLKANLELALLDLDRINSFGILYPIKGQISFVKEELEIVIDNLERASYLSKIIPSLAGYPEAGNFLFIMQNNDELRPSGGFIGVYGLMKTKNGSVDSLITHDSYHLDMPASISGRWNLQPPAALNKYLKVEKWYLRDANWSPDWPSSARNIAEIYQGEKLAISETTDPFTGIIALAPDFVAELLDVTGPVMARGELYEKENFQELLQYSVEVSYSEQDISSWDRKDVINEIVYELKNKLTKISIGQFYSLLNIISNNIANKNIQLYFSDDYLQGLAQRLNATGEVKNNIGDYLLVVDANLGAFKSDAVVKKSINYDMNLEDSLSRVNLRLNYRHEGGFDWRTTRYRSYTRVYVPLGSKLNKLETFGLAKIENDSIISYDDKDLGKTVFAFFFTLEPGTAGGIDVEYELSDSLTNYFKNNSYSLLLQKQSGRRTESFDFQLKSKGKLKQEGSYPLEKDLFIGTLNSNPKLN